MIPIDQTIFDKDKGNCFPACLASILEYHLPAIPNFCLKSTWHEDANEWLKQFKLGLITFNIEPGSLFQMPLCYYILSGDGPRECRHSVVGELIQDNSTRKMIIVHDPHPSREGLLGNLKDWNVECFVCIEPGEAVLEWGM